MSEAWSAEAEQLAQALEHNTNGTLASPSLVTTPDAVERQLQQLPVQQILDLPLLARLRTALDASGLSAVVRREVQASSSSLSSQPCSQDNSRAATDPLAAPEAVSSLLSRLFERSDGPGQRQGPLEHVCQQIASQALAQECTGNMPSVEELLQDPKWNWVPTEQDLRPPVRNTEEAPDCQVLRFSQDEAPAGAFVFGDGNGGFDALSMEGSMEDLLCCGGDDGSEGSELQLGFGGGGGEHEQTTQLFGFGGGGGEQATAAEVWGCDSQSWRGEVEGGEQRKVFGESSGSESSSSGEWEEGAGGGFNAGTVKRNVARLADPSQRLTALRVLSGTDAAGNTARNAASLMGVHPEDVVFSPAWPTLCASLPTCLVMPALTHPSYTSDNSTFSRDQQRERSTHSASGKGGDKERAAAVVLNATAVLVEQLAKECVRTSPVHVVQLLRALVPFLLAGPLLLSNHGPTASVHSLSSSALSLLRSLTHDWHFLPTPSQTEAAHAVCSLLAAHTQTDLHSSTHSITHNITHSSMHSSTQQANTHSRTHSEEDVCPLRTLLQLDPNLQWLQRLTNASCSAHTLSTAAITPLTTHSPAANSDLLASAGQSPAPHTLSSPSSTDQHNSTPLLQLLVNALQARSLLRQRQPQPQHSSTKQQSQPPTKQSQPTPLPSHSPQTHTTQQRNSKHTTQTQEQLVPAAACALLMLPPHAWQGVQIHGDLTPHSQQHQRSTHTSVAPSTFTVSAEQPVNSEQSSVQQHVTRLLTEEALAAVADDVTVDIQACSWVHTGLVPLATLMPHYFTSTTDCAPQPLLARCKQVLSAVSAEGSALRAQSAAGKAATQPATSRAQAASATAAAPVTSRAQATGATAAPNRANTTAATPHHSRASTRSPSPPASAPSLNPQNQLSQHPAHNHTPQNQSSQHPVHNHTHLLHLTASLYTALAQSQCGADALLLTSTPSQHSTSKEAGSSSVSQQQREKKDSLLPSQRPVNNSTQAQKDSQLEACAREVVACQARLCFAGARPPSSPSFAAPLLPPAAWRLVESVSIACSHASAPLSLLQHSNGGVRGLVLSLVQLIDRLSNSSNSSNSSSVAYGSAQPISNSSSSNSVTQNAARSRDTQQQRVRRSSSDSDSSSKGRFQSAQQHTTVQQRTPHSTQHTTPTAPHSQHQQHHTDTACDALIQCCHCCHIAAITAPLLSSHPTAARCCAQRLLTRLRTLSATHSEHTVDGSDAKSTQHTNTSSSITAPTPSQHTHHTLSAAQRPLLTAASHLALGSAMQGVLVEAGVLQHVVLQGLSESLLGGLGTSLTQHTQPVPSAATTLTAAAQAATTTAAAQAATTTAAAALPPTPLLAKSNSSKPPQPSSKSLSRSLSLPPTAASNAHNNSRSQQHQQQQQSSQQNTPPPALPTSQHSTPNNSTPPNPLTSTFSHNTLSSSLHAHPADYPQLIALRSAQAVLSWQQLSLWLPTPQGRNLLNVLLSLLRHTSENDAGPCDIDVAHVALRCLLMWLSDDRAMQVLRTHTHAHQQLVRLVEAGGVEQQADREQPGSHTHPQLSAPTHDNPCVNASHFRVLHLPVDMNTGAALLLLSRLIPASTASSASDGTRTNPTEHHAPSSPIDVGEALSQLLNLAAPCLHRAAALLPHADTLQQSHQQHSGQSPLCPPQHADTRQQSHHHHQQQQSQQHQQQQASLPANAKHTSTESSLLQQYVTRSWPPAPFTHSSHPPSVPLTQIYSSSSGSNSAPPSRSSGALTQPPQPVKASSFKRSSSLGRQHPTPSDIRIPTTDTKPSPSLNRSSSSNNKSTSNPPQSSSSSKTATPVAPSQPLPWSAVVHRLRECEAALHSTQTSSVHPKPAPLPSQAAVQAVQSALHALSPAHHTDTAAPLLPYTPTHGPLNLSSPSLTDSLTPTQRTHSSSTASALHIGGCPDLDLPAALAASTATVYNHSLLLLHHSRVVSAAAALTDAGTHNAAVSSTATHTDACLCSWVLVDGRGVVRNDGSARVNRRAAEHSSAHTPTAAPAQAKSCVQVAAVARLLDAVWGCLGVNNTRTLAGRGSDACSDALCATASLVVVMGCLVGLAADMKEQGQQGGHSNRLLPEGEREQQATSAALRVLASIAASPAALCVWPALAWAGVGDESGRGVSKEGVLQPFSSGAVCANDSMRCAMCSALAWVLQRCEPALHAVLCGSAGDGLGLASLLHTAAQWMSGQGGASTSGLAFSGWLSSRDVITLLVVQLVLGPDYLVYAAAAIVKHMEPELREAAMQGNVEPFLAACCSFPGFSADQMSEYMVQLAERCRPCGVMSYLERSCCV